MKVACEFSARKATIVDSFSSTRIALPVANKCKHNNNKRYVRCNRCIVYANA